MHCHRYLESATNCCFIVFVVVFFCFFLILIVIINIIVIRPRKQNSLFLRPARFFIT